MDVFTPGLLIKDQRILTCVTFNIFQVKVIKEDTKTLEIFIKADFENFTLGSDNIQKD